MRLKQRKEVEAMKMYNVGKYLLSIQENGRNKEQKEIYLINVFLSDSLDNVTADLFKILDKRGNKVVKSTRSIDDLAESIIKCYLTE